MGGRSQEVEGNGEGRDEAAGRFEGKGVMQRRKTGEGERDDERAEKAVSATLLPPGLTASQSTEDDDEEDNDDEDEDDGASVSDSTSTSRSASLSASSLFAHRQSKEKTPSASNIAPSLQYHSKAEKGRSKAGTVLPPLKPKRVILLVGEKKKKKKGDGGAGGESDAAKESGASEGRAEWMMNGIGRMDGEVSNLTSRRLFSVSKAGKR